LVALVALTIAACSAGPATQPSAVAQVTLAPVAVTPVVTPEPPTEPPTPKPATKLTPKPTTAPPPKPTGVKFFGDERECVDGNWDEGCVRSKRTQTVLWKAPRTKGVEIRVFGVIGCLAEPENPEPGAHGPCLVKGTNLPSSVRTLLAKAPASAGWVSWSWTQEEYDCDIDFAVGTAPDGRGYDAVVVQAFNAHDRSSFAIAEPGGWAEPAPGDHFC
jgi:hypothetical protein